MHRQGVKELPGTIIAVETLMVIAPIPSKRRKSKDGKSRVGALKHVGGKGNDAESNKPNQVTN